MSLYLLNYSRNTIIALGKTIQISRALVTAVDSGGWCPFYGRKSWIL
jgi:hypothetical protein